MAPLPHLPASKPPQPIFRHASSCQPPKNLQAPFEYLYPWKPRPSHSATFHLVFIHPRWYSPPRTLQSLHAWPLNRASLSTDSSICSFRTFENFILATLLRFCLFSSFSFFFQGKDGDFPSLPKTFFVFFCFSQTQQWQLRRFWVSFRIETENSILFC